MQKVLPRLNLCWRAPASHRDLVILSSSWGGLDGKKKAGHSRSVFS